MMPPAKTRTAKVRKIHRRMTQSKPHSPSCAEMYGPAPESILGARHMVVDDESGVRAGGAEKGGICWLVVVCVADVRLC